MSSMLVDRGLRLAPIAQSLHLGEDSEGKYWNVSLDLAQLPYLVDHAFQGMVVLPGSAYVTLALIIAKEVGLRPTALRTIKFENVLVLQADQPAAVKLTCRAQRDGTWRFGCTSLDGQISYATMMLETDRGEGELPSLTQPVTQIEERLGHPLSRPDFYSILQQAGNEYGPAFQGVEQLWSGQDEAVARIQLASDITADLTHYDLHPVLLDVCTHVLPGIDLENGRTFVLTGFDAIQLTQPVQDIAWSYAQLTSADDTGLIGNISLLNTAGEVVATLLGANFKYLEGDSKAAETKTKVAVSATFTSEPVEETLNFWADQLNTPLDIEFAPYNQVFQQLLDPTSLLAQNRDGLNVLLLRLEDWIRDAHGLKLQVDAEEKARILANHQTYQLPNQVEIAHLNQYETEYVYKEIFVDRSYMKHGIQINDGDTVIDIGANIGLFSMFVQQECPNTTIYAFEPSPPVFQMLKSNAQLYGSDVHAFNLGVSDRVREATFTFYEKSSVFSSFHADEEEDEAAVREVVINMLEDSGIVDEEEQERYVAELMADRMNSIPYTCQLTSVSDIIREQQIEQIDLLKVDAEKSELDILNGIADEDWFKIKQIVLEVHDQQGDLIRNVQNLLRSKGFTLAIEEEDLLQNSGLYNIFGTRQEIAQTAAVPSDAPQNLHQKIEQNVADFLAAVTDSVARSTTPHLVIACPPSPAAAADGRLHALFTRMEDSIADQLATQGNIYFVSSQELLDTYPVEDYYDPHGDKLGHVPYTPQFFGGLGTMMARKLQAIRRAPYKVIVLDCDNTLWNGVVGEDGPLGIDFSGPWEQLQHFMIQQHDAGMLLCLCSKNVEEDVFAVFEQRPEMPLKLDHIVSQRINWQPKSENIKSLAAELNLGLDSFIFIDDNPVECAEVSAALPEVLTLRRPDAINEIPRFLQHVWAFDHLKVTTEDRQRTAMYQQNVARQQYRQSARTLTDFLDGLQLKIDIAAPTEAQMPRVAQLTQRTNQFNFTTIRRTQAELEQLRASGRFDLAAVTVSDRFGDYGLVGDLFYQQEGDALVVDTFLLSCRVLGRGVEHRMVAYLGEIAASHDLSIVQIAYQPTAKNKPALDFLTSIGADYQEASGEGFIFRLPTAYAQQMTYRPEAGATTAEERTTSVKSRRAKRIVDYADIASTLNDTATILSHVNKQKSRQRSPAAVYAAPTNNLERSMAAIWQSVLGIDKIGVNENFREIGGTSLKGVQLIAQIKRELGLNLSIIDLFEHPTIAALAAMQENGNGHQTAEAQVSSGHDRGSRRRELRKARRRR